MWPNHWVISEPGLECGSRGLCLDLSPFESTSVPVCSGLHAVHTEEVRIEEHRWMMGEKVLFRPDNPGVCVKKGWQTTWFYGVDIGLYWIQNGINWNISLQW